MKMPQNFRACGAWGGAERERDKRLCFVGSSGLQYSYVYTWFSKPYPPHEVFKEDLGGGNPMASMLYVCVGGILFLAVDYR